MSAYTHEVSTSFSSFNSISCDDVAKLISSSKNKSSSLDPVPTPVLKMAINYIAPSITEIINKSLTSGVFPSSYKSAVLKKAHLDPSLLKNYRPISNLGFVSKILEKVVTLQLTSYLSDNNLLEPYQSAYRTGHSTETALLRVQNDIVHAIGDHKAVLLVLLDLSAAFDTVNHALLIDSLSHLGVKDTVLKWITSYLEDRTQAVKVNNITSSCHKVSCGVPQGSVLGPLLFIIYTSSLGKLLRLSGYNYQLYADDTQIWATCKTSDVSNTMNQLEHCISIIQKWMSEHQLKLNDDKTEFLIVSSGRSTCKLEPIPMFIGGQKILPVTSVRNLGVVMDSHASMEAHVAAICKSSYVHLFTLNKIKKYLDNNSIEQLVHAFITSRLDYCNALLCGLPSKLISKLQRVQNAAARMLTGVGKNEHITPVLKSLHWLPVQQRINFKILVLVFKAIHSDGPQYLTEMIEHHIPSRQLRSSDSLLLKVPFTRSTIVQNSAFSVIGPRLWNQLPLSIKAASSISIFKSQIKTLLFKEFYGGS